MTDKSFRILKCDSDLFLVDIEGKLVLCNARKKIRLMSDIIPGDFVKIEKTSDESYVIDSVLPRKNMLIRPSVANIDSIIIFIAPIPLTDYILIDKLIINAKRQGLDVVICVNKTDLPTTIKDEVLKQYEAAVDKIVFVSAANNDIDELRQVLKGSLSCFAGQSAVGKSSIINALTGNNLRTVGALSVKNERGKNTTTSAEIICLDKNTYIIDTPGFSMLEIHDELNYEELDLYYAEFMAYSMNCRFNRCSHTAEPDCAVKAAVGGGTINSDRYERYKLIREELKALNANSNKKNKRPTTKKY